VAITSVWAKTLNASDRASLLTWRRADGGPVGTRKSVERWSVHSLSMPTTRGVDK